MASVQTDSLNKSIGNVYQIMRIEANFTCTPEHGYTPGDEAIIITIPPVLENSKTDKLSIFEKNYYKNMYSNINPSSKVFQFIMEDQVSH